MPLKLKDFPYGHPVPLSFKELAPREAPSQFGGPELAFSSHQGAIYLPVFAGRMIADLLRDQMIQPDEPVRVMRTKTAQGDRFTVERERGVVMAPVASGHASNGNGHGHAPDGGGQGNPLPPVSGSVQAISARMMACFMAAVDAVAEAQTYADRRGLKVTFTSEDVRSCAISCYIQCEKAGR